jgi:hypothetical protein
MNDTAAEAPPTGQPVGQGVQAILSEGSATFVS